MTEALIVSYFERPGFNYWRHLEMFSGFHNSEASRDFVLKCLCWIYEKALNMDDETYSWFLENTVRDTDDIGEDYLHEINDEIDAQEWEMKLRTMAKQFYKVAYAGHRSKKRKDADFFLACLISIWPLICD